MARTATRSRSCARGDHDTRAVRTAATTSRARTTTGTDGALSRSSHHSSPMATPLSTAPRTLTRDAARPPTRWPPRPTSQAQLWATIGRPAVHQLHGSTVGTAPVVEDPVAEREMPPQVRVERRSPGQDPGQDEQDGGDGGAR